MTPCPDPGFRFSRGRGFTENTLISGEIMPAHIVNLNDWQAEEWPGTPEGGERQAREISGMYTVLRLKKAP